MQRKILSEAKSWNHMTATQTEIKLCTPFTRGICPAAKSIQSAMQNEEHCSNLVTLVLKVPNSERLKTAHESRPI